MKPVVVILLIKGTRHAIPLQSWPSIDRNVRKTPLWRYSERVPFVIQELEYWRTRQTESGIIFAVTSYRCRQCGPDHPPSHFGARQQG